jgi:peptidoglycan/LPS O-acetylase OafA/YrhL
MGSVVPGGRTVSLEVMFYLFLPLLARYAVNLRRALQMFAVACVIAAGSQLYASYLGIPLHAIERSQWFPAQLPVFVLGFILYFLIFDGKGRNPKVYTAFAVPALCLLAGVAALRPSLLSGDLIQPIRHVVISAALMVIAWVIAEGGIPWTVNFPIRKLGINSFSAYICHWCVIGVVLHIIVPLVPALKHFALCLTAILVLTYCLSSLLHQLVEDPAIRIGKRVIRYMSLVQETA